MFRSRRRSPYGAYLCAVISALLLLLSVSLLYSRLSLSHSHTHSIPRTLLSDSDSDADSDDSDLSTSDPIDELDFIDLDQQQQQNQPPNTKPSLYFFDPLSSAIRRSFKTPPIFIDEITTDEFTIFSSPQDTSKSAFSSDDIPLDDDVIHKATIITSIEDALLLKSPSLRENWGEWFDKKALFLRKDKMLKSSFEAFNPMLNPLLQDPDAVGASGLTRGDRILYKWWINEFKNVPFSPHKNINNGKLTTVAKGVAERRTLNDNDNDKDKAEFFNRHIYADGNNWGYFPELPLRLSFNHFMDAFFRKGKCVMRVFMVWNSPTWMFTVRYQRGLESLLFHHPNACVVVFSETIELDFFKDSFVKDG